MDVPIVGRYCFCYRLYNRCGVSCVRLFFEKSFIIIQAQYPVPTSFAFVGFSCAGMHFIEFHGDSDQSEKKFSLKSLYLDLFPKISGLLFG